MIEQTAATIHVGVNSSAASSASAIALSSPLTPSVPLPPSKGSRLAVTCARFSAVTFVYTVPEARGALASLRRLLAVGPAAQGANGIEELSGGPGNM